MKISQLIYNNPEKISGLNFTLTDEVGESNDVDNLLLSYRKTFPEYDIWEFGTFLGQSICGITTWLDKNDIKINRFIGFDSLKGLPLEENDPLNNPGWYESNFSIDKHTSGRITTSEQYKNFLIQTERLPVSYSNKFILIPGYFKDSLNDDIFTINNLKLPLLINIDCDIYTSTIEVLDFIFRNNYYIKGKTIIRYDDWANNGFEFKTGNSRAHFEMTNKYGINCKLLLKHSFGEYKDPECTWFIIEN